MHKPYYYYKYINFFFFLSSFLPFVIIIYVLLTFFYIRFQITGSAAAAVYLADFRVTNRVTERDPCGGADKSRDLSASARRKLPTRVSRIRPVDCFPAENTVRPRPKSDRGKKKEEIKLALVVRLGNELRLIIIIVVDFLQAKRTRVYVVFTPSGGKKKFTPSPPPTKKM